MSATTHPNTSPRAWSSQTTLSRPREGRMIAGVAAGFARRYEIDPVVARLVTVAAIVVLSPLVYVAAWILMPKDPATPSES
jgi:phage shock protein PspC (stress-responsive transcriptional regulator)